MLSIKKDYFKYLDIGRLKAKVRNKTYHVNINLKKKSKNDYSDK